MKPNKSVPDDSNRMVECLNAAHRLFKKSEYSVAVIRAGTALELALNTVLRRELQIQRKLPHAFVDGLFLWANGFKGKLDRLLKPLLGGTLSRSGLKQFETMARRVNKERNEVAHSGVAKSKTMAAEVISLAEQAILTLLSLYDDMPKTVALVDEDDVTAMLEKLNQRLDVALTKITKA